MRTVSRKLMLALWMICLPLAGHSDEVDRIEDILNRKTFSPDGQVLISEVRASVEGCAIRIELERPGACEAGASFFSTTEYIDVRVLVSSRDAAEFKDFSGTRFEQLKGAAIYRYRSLYDRLLRFANEQATQIRDEEYENFPTDVDSRLRILSRRYSEEIDANSYSRSVEITQYCSGIEIKSPLNGLNFTFYIEPSEADEFAGLIEELSQNCKAGIGS